MAEALVARAVDLLGQLVAFDTTSSKSNLELIEFIEDLLSRTGVDSHRIANKEGTKANLCALIGPREEGGVVLSGHTDVVPVEGQQWDSEPFHLTHKGTRLHGRGTADMKSFLAVCLAMLPEFRRAALKKPLILAFSYDEEVGCLGVPSLADYLEQKLPRPAFAVIGEPTDMQVVTAHKGVYSFETVVTGLEGHSSAPHRGVNAVQVASRLVYCLEQMAQELAEKGMRDGAFDPPCSTVHVGVMGGGTARNIIPGHCRFLWEMRPLPGDHAEALLRRFKEYCAEQEKQMHAVFPGASIVTRPQSRMKGFRFAGQPDSETLMMRCAGANATAAVSFGTEAGVFQDHKIPAIVCGPGSIDQAHKPNEYIEKEQIERCVAFLRRLVEALC